MPATHSYDLVLLLDASADDEVRTKILADTEKLLADKGATVATKHEWGTRRTAYEIRHKDQVEFHLLQFDGTPDVPDALNRVLRITDGITRHRVLRLEPDAPKPGELPEVPAVVNAEPESAPVERL